MLSQEELNAIFEYRDGQLYWKRSGHKRHNGKRAGYFCHTIDYRVISIKDKPYREHRIIYTMFNGLIPQGYDIDHKDNDTQNNKIENLRACTRSQNTQNKKISKNRFGYKGIWRDSENSWHYSIAKKGENRILKYGFKTALSAFEARNIELIKIHGEYANSGS